MRKKISVMLSRAALAAAVVLAVGGCAQLAGPTAARTAAGGASGPAAAAAAKGVAAPSPSAAASAAAGAPPARADAAGKAPGTPPPFDTVVKQAKKTDGLFPVWRKDEKVWLELKPEDFGKPLYLSPKIARGIGQQRLFGGTMFGRWRDVGRAQIVQLRKVHNQVRMVASNTEYRANEGTPEARAVAAGFSESLIGSAPLASAPHPQRKSVLVDANALFAGDMLGLGISLQRAFRQGYSLDARHSGIDKVRTRSDAVIFEITQHFHAASINVPQGAGGSGHTTPGAPAPTTPVGLPDARSMFFGVHFSLSKLPETPMAPRLADARVGYFATVVNDFSNDLARTPTRRFVNRWRLEKKDPSAAISEPVQPITFWLDKTIPTAYRGAMAEGILEWNKAFEKIGFRNAIAVRQQSDDADFDTLDVGVASVRWMTNAQPAFGATGPSQVDPRTGEILDADIGVESLASRDRRALKSQILGGGFTMDWGALLQASDAVAEGALPGTAGEGPHAHDATCQHADFAAEQLAYALDVLEARGEIDPDSPEVQQFVLDALKKTTMHEVGHTLGLRHNFRSSRIYTDAQMSDEAFVRAHGLAGSVMEYAPLNLPRPGDRPTFAFQTTLGPYDYWAIEYAYKPIDAKDEAAELQRIASRSAEPQLAYGTDEDNFLGIDPESLQFDLGDDPVAFAKKRFEIGRDVIARQESRRLKPDADYSVLRRSISYAVRDIARAAGILARQIGGVRTLRDRPGSGRDPLQPLPAAVQREALDALAKGLFAADSLRVSAALQRKLAPDFDERAEAAFGGATGTTDFAFDSFVSELRRATLAQLTTDGLASRILDNASRVGPGEAFSLAELYGRLGDEIWSELGSKGDIPAPRRELQREHVNKLAAQMLRPSSSRADARSLLRAQAKSLARRLETASRRAGLSPEARAHLEDSRETLSLALAARLQRSGL